MTDLAPIVSARGLKKRFGRRKFCMASISTFPPAASMA